MGLKYGYFKSKKIILKIMGNCIAGHSSINMLKRLMVNIEAFSTIRAAYSSPSAFDVHPTSHHKEQDPIHDQLKAMWFCLKENVISDDASDDVIPKMTKEGNCEGNVQQSLIDVYSKGKLKVKQQFSRMLYEKFNVFVSEQSDNESSDSA